MKKLATFLIFGAFVTSVSAQVNKDVEVTRNYDPNVMDAQKIWYEPTSTTDSTAVKDAFSYSIFPKSSPGNFGLTPISSAKFTNNNDEDPGLGYIRAGIGYQISPLLDFYISNNNTETALVGFYANHRSFFGKTKLVNGDYNKKVKSDYMNNDLGLFGKIFLDGSTVTLNADYSRRDLIMYGLDPALFSVTGFNFEEKNNKRAFNLFNLNALWKSDAEEGEVYYSLGASYQYFNGKNKKGHINTETMTENAFALSGLLGAELGFEGQDVSIAVRAAMYKRNNILDSFGNNILLSATPAWTYKDDYLSVKLGAQFVLDSYDGPSKNKLYPAISASYKIDDAFIPMIELKGETEVNNFRKIASENPYVQFPQALDAISFRNTYHKLVGIFSIRGDVEAFSYNAFVSYSDIDNLMLYANNQYSTSVYDYDYNSFANAYVSAKKTSIGAELSYHDDIFSAYIKGVYNNYSINKKYNIDHAWHRPGFETNMNLRYRLLDNLVLTADARCLFARYAMDNATYKERKLKNIFDIGVGAEVLLTPKFSVFVNFANIFNQKYDVYSRYQVPGFIASAGITYKF